MSRILSALLSLLMLAVPTFGENSTKYAALTFDDGPSGRYTRQLLDGLAERGVKATFLLCGYRMKEYPQELERIAAEGHEIGCHGYSHKNMQTLGRREIAAEIMDTEALYPSGIRVRFLRPPGGCCSDGVKQVAEARGLAILQWSVDPRDWATDNTAEIVDFVVEHTEDGDVILLHDMSDSSVQAAFAIIDRLTEKGFQFVTATELAALRHTTVKPGKSYFRFPKKEES